MKKFFVMVMAAMLLVAMVGCKAEKKPAPTTAPTETEAVQ